MKNTKQILIYYYFQQQQTLQYNVARFKQVFQKPEDIKIRNVLACFPFDVFNGHYHFRFKSQFKQANQNVVGWIDISNLLSKVPLYNNAIYVKILKIKSNAYNKLFSRQKLQVILPQPIKKNLSDSEHILNGNQKIEVPKHQTLIKTPPQPQKKQQEDLLSFESYPSSTQVNTIQNQPNNPPKSMNNTVEIKKSPDLMPDSHQVTIQQPINIPPNGKPGRGFEEQTTAQKIAGFQQQVKQQQNQREAFRQAGLELDQKIQKWAYSSKVRKNFRTLLVTVQQIWQFGNWKEITVGQLLTDNDLKKYYKKALLFFHPDKHKLLGDYRRTYLCKRIASELSEAFKKI